MSLFRCSRWFKDMLEDFDPFWKQVCIKEDFMNYDTLLHDDGEEVRFQSQFAILFFFALQELKTCEKL